MGFRVSRVYQSTTTALLFLLQFHLLLLSSTKLNTRTILLLFDLLTSCLLFRVLGASEEPAARAAAARAIV